MEMHAHLSRHRQAEYAPGASRSQERREVAPAYVAQPAKIGSAGQEAESRDGKSVGRPIAIREKYLTSHSIS
jgi:hypothetical protein